MQIYVVRHGETNVNVENRINSTNDDDLNEKGIREATELREIVKDIDYDFIISSPLVRAKHTAELLNAKEKEIILDKRLQERDAGTYTKTSIDDIDSYDWWNVYPQKDYGNAEKVLDVISRVHEFLDEIKEKYKDKNIILVTHGGISKTINCYFTGIPKDGNISTYSHNHCEILTYKL
ncbi:MAG: histidine phosphatase family protein [Clostridiales bacterium]|nr:histidine phosphatase family protein [Clostridiales bacterium]